MMKKINNGIVYIIFLVCVSFSALAVDRNTFWHTTQKGANIFNQTVSRDDIKAAKSYGIKFIRLSPDRFISKQRDFLLGDADHYRGLVPEDLTHLKKILDMCIEEKMPVVLTMLSLPGSHWKQKNANKDDLRIWTNEDFQRQAGQFWQDVATALKDHPAIVGYNILNEPHAERIYNANSNIVSAPEKTKIQKLIHGFYAKTIARIRRVDQNTPIILDCTAHADPKAFEYLQPQNLNNILYSFHIYEPYVYTNVKINKGKFVYPGVIESKTWNKKALKEYMQSVVDFQKKYHVPSESILVGEFGGNRESQGLENYFRDLISIFNANHWHYAFYAFREDIWHGMDYELGDKKLPWAYWQAKEKGETPVLSRSEHHSIFKVITGDM